MRPAIYIENVKCQYCGKIYILIENCGGCDNGCPPSYSVLNHKNVALPNAVVQRIQEPVTQVLMELKEVSEWLLESLELSQYFYSGKAPHNTGEKTLYNCMSEIDANVEQAFAFMRMALKALEQAHGRPEV